jgi:hypothetical protein
VQLQEQIDREGIRRGKTPVEPTPVAVETPPVKDARKVLPAANLGDGIPREAPPARLNTHKNTLTL